MMRMTQTHHGLLKLTDVKCNPRSELAIPADCDDAEYPDLNEAAAHRCAYTINIFSAQTSQNKYCPRSFL